MMELVVSRVIELGKLVAKAMVAQPVPSSTCSAQMCKSTPLQTCT